MDEMPLVEVHEATTEAVPWDFVWSHAINSQSGRGPMRPRYGLAACEVAELLGLTTKEVQRIEHNAMRKLRRMLT